MIKIDERLIDFSKLTDVAHIISPTETVTLYFVNGRSIEFTGDMAAFLWEYLCGTNVERELS